MISIDLSGRLGNQMFQYSICRIISEKNNFNFYIPEVGTESTNGVHIKKYFPNLDLGVKDGETLYYYTEDHTIQKFNHEIFKLRDFTHLWGFFQSPKYFIGYEEKIKSWFQLPKNDTVNCLINQYNPSDFCFIHMRGTDYKNHGHWFLNKEYYTKAMEYVKNINDNISFLIITDDLETSKNWFPNIECIKNEDFVDLGLLIKCNYIIISNSTFAWWGAWLSEKKVVVAPQNWLNYNTPYLGFYPKDIKTENFYYLN